MAKEKKQLIISIYIDVHVVRVVLGQFITSKKNEAHLKVLGAAEETWTFGTFERGKLKAPSLFQETIKSASNKASLQACLPISEDEVTIIASLTSPSVVGVSTEGIYPMLPLPQKDDEDQKDLSEDEKNLERNNLLEVLRSEELTAAKEFALRRACGLYPNYADSFKDILNLQVDGRDVSENDYMTTPTGKTLTLKMHFIMMPQSYTAQILPLIAQCFLRTSINDYCFCGLTPPLITSNENEIESGLLSVNIGYSSTQFIAWKNGSIQRSGQINVGTQHFINDIFIAFKMKEFAEAELLFRNLSHFGSLIREDDGPARLVNNEFSLPLVSPVYMSDVELVITARAKELFSIIFEKLKEDPNQDWITSDMMIKITGEGAHLPQLAEFIQETFNVQTSTNFIINPDIKFDNDELKQQLRSEWACALGGLVFHNYNKSQEHDSDSFDIMNSIKKFSNKIKDTICQKIPSIVQS